MWVNCFMCGGDGLDDTGVRYCEACIGMGEVELEDEDDDQALGEDDLDDLE